MLSYLYVIIIGICYHIYWNMLSYLLKYFVIFIGIRYHIYWNTLSYLLKCVNIPVFIVICNLIYWNMLSYLLEYVILFIGICHTIIIGICYHIYGNMLSYLLEYVIIFIGIRHYIYWNMSNNSKNIDKWTKDFRAFQYFWILFFFFIISLYSYGLFFYLLIWNTMHDVSVYIFKNIIHIW